MSNTEIDDGRGAPAAPVTFNWFGGEDVRAAITVDPDLSANKVTQVSFDEARGKLRDRLKVALAAGRKASGVALSDYAEESIDAEVDGMAQAIVWSFTDNEMYAEVVDNVDLRPYVKFFADHPEARFRTMQRRMDFDQKAVPQTRDVVMAGLQDEVRTQVLKLQTNSERSPEERDAAVDKYEQFDPSTAGRSIEQLLVTKQTEIGNTATSPEQAEEMLLDNPDPYAYLDEEIIRDPIVFPVDDLTQMLSTGYISTLEQLADAEAVESDRTGQAGFVPFMVDEEYEFPTGHGRKSPAKLNGIDATAWIFTLKEDEVATIQRNLEAAGYFDSADGTLAYDEGYAQDFNTREAWKKALIDAGGQRIPVPQLLREQAQRRGERRAQQRAELQDEARKTWNNRDSEAILAEQANAYAMEQLGRRLEPDELAGVTSYIKGLQSERINSLGDEEGDTSWQNDESLSRGFTTDELDRDVGNRLAGEVNAENSFDAWQGANDFFGVTTQSTPADFKAHNEAARAAAAKPKPAGSRTNV